jgi:hypothetical protein
VNSGGNLKLFPSAGYLKMRCKIFDMSISKGFLLTFCLAVLCWQTAPAQTGGAAISPTPEQIPTVRFRTLGLEGDIGKELFFREAEQYTELPLRFMKTSDSSVARLLADGSLPLFERVESEEGGYQYKLFTRMNLPQNSKRVLILAAGAGERLAFKAIADNLSSSDKDWLYINTSKAMLAVQLGEESKPVGIGPGASVFHRTDLEYGRGAPVRVAMRENGEWKRAYSRFWPIREGQRMIVIFMEREDELVVYRFSDNVERPNVNPQQLNN